MVESGRTHDDQVPPLLGNHAAQGAEVFPLLDPCLKAREGLFEQLLDRFQIGERYFFHARIDEG